MKKKMVRFALAALPLSLLAHEAQAQTDPFADAELGAINAEAGAQTGIEGDIAADDTAIAAEQIQQENTLLDQLSATLTEVDDLNTQVQSLASLATSDWDTLQGFWQQTNAVFSDGVVSTLEHAVSNYVASFSSNAATQAPSFSSQVGNWTQSSMDSLNTAMSLTNAQTQNLAAEQAQTANITTLASSAGAVQLQQLTLQLAAQQVQQIQELRQLEIAQMQAQDSYLGAETSRQSHDLATTESHFVAYNASQNAQSNGQIFNSAGGRD